MKKYFILNLQLFAEAGTLVNATGNYVNAYTGDTTAFDSTNTLAGELKTFYDTELLENARIEMFYAQFAKKQKLPANHGTTVEWRKWNTFAKASKLQEGVIPSGQKFGMSSKTGSIAQYGTYAAITDTLELRAYDDTILGHCLKVVPAHVTSIVASRTVVVVPVLCGKHHGNTRRKKQCQNNRSHRCTLGL